MFAIVQAGGRQRKVETGTELRIDRLEAEPGAEITLDQVLLVETADGEVKTGTPFVKGASVTATVLAQVRDKKVRVFKMKRRKHYRRTRGHRTELTRVRVDKITV